MRHEALMALHCRCLFLTFFEIYCLGFFQKNQGAIIPDKRENYDLFSTITEKKGGERISVACTVRGVSTVYIQRVKKKIYA